MMRRRISSMVMLLLAAALGGAFPAAPEPAGALARRPTAVPLRRPAKPQSNRPRPSLALQVGHGAAITCLAFSPDGRTLATGSHDKTVRLWDAASGQLKAILQGHGSSVLELAFSPDGKILATASSDRTARLWDLATRQLKATLQAHAGSALWALAFSPDSTTLATANYEKAVRLWDVPGAHLKVTLQAQIQVSPPGIGINTLAFSPDGKAVGTGGGALARLWDVETGQPKVTFQEHSTKVFTYALSPDGKMVATGSDDHLVRLWDAQSGQLKAVLPGHTRVVSSVAFSPDGTTLATGSYDKTVRLWDAQSGQLKATLQGHNSAVSMLLFSADGRTLVTRSWDKTVRLWHSDRWQLLATLSGDPGLTTAPALSPDGKTVVTGAAGVGSPKYWGSGGGSYRFEADATQAHSGKFSGRIRHIGPDVAWRAVSQTILPDPFLGKQVRYSGYLKTEDASEWAGLWMLVSGPGGTALRFYNMSDREVRGSTDWQRYEIVLDVPKEALSITFGIILSGKGTLWADDLSLAVLDEADPGRVITPQLNDARNLDFEAGPEDAAARLWDAETGQSKGALQGNGLWALSFSPDGKTLATASWDNTVRLWDVASRQPKATLQSTGVPIVFAPDSRTLATGSSDRAVRLWDVETGRLRVALQGQETAAALAFSRDGTTLAMSSPMGKIVLWNAATGKPAPLTPPIQLPLFPVRIRTPFSIDGAALVLHDTRDGRVLATMLPMLEAAEAAAAARPIAVGAKPIEIGAKAALAPGNEWFVATPEGYFDCSANAARFIRWNVSGTLYPAERFLRRFRRPDLVRKALRGERITAPEMSADDIPPAARFIGLRDGASVPGDPMAVTVEARGVRRVKEVELLVNGRPLPPEVARPIDVGAKPIEVGAKEGEPNHRIVQRFTFRFPLPVGAEEIHLRAVAYDATDLGSDPVEIVLKRAGAKPVAGNLYVLAVGVSRYQNADRQSFHNLQYPAADAQAIAARFRREGKPLYDRAVVRTLADEQATAANVRAGLKWLQESVRPGQIDTVVIFLSGHGISDNGRYYFAAHDLDLNNVAGTSISGRELREALGGRLQAKPVFLFVDTCHAGGLSGRSDDLALEVGDGVYVLASSGAKEYSYESSSWQHGAFTLALLRSLGRRELARDGLIRFGALAYSVSDEVAALMTEAGRNESEQVPCVPLAARDLRMPIAVAAR